MCIFYDLHHKYYAESKKEPGAKHRTPNKVNSIINRILPQLIWLIIPVVNVPDLPAIA
jgi:hypothetical protein